MRVLLTNIHSLANLGDWALLQRSLQLIETALPGAEVTLVADFPETVRGRFPGYQVLGSPWAWAYQPRPRPAWLRHLLLFVLLLFVLPLRLRWPVRLLPLPALWRTLLAAYLSADLVVAVAGGSLIAATPQSAPAGYFSFVAAPAWLALLLGRRLVLLPATYGPFASALPRALALTVLRNARLACTRTEGAVLRLSVRRRILPGIDLAAALPMGAADQARAAAILTAAGLPIGARPLALAVHDWRSQHGQFERQTAAEDLLRRLLDDLTSRGLYVLLVPQSGGPLLLADDRRVLRRIAAQARFPTRVLLLDLPPDPATAQAIYARAGAVLTSRLHGAIFAANVGTPLLALDYQRKMADALAPLGLAEAVVPIESATLPLLRDRLLALYAHPQSAAPSSLRRAREQWQELTAALRHVMGLPNDGAA